MTNAPAKTWQPYGGYDPKSRGPPSSASSFSSAPADSLSSAPNKKWVGGYGGYDPKNRGAPAPMASQASAIYEPASAAAPSYSAAPADVMTNAPAKTWQPYGGYDPKSRGPPSASSFSSAPADSLSSAPAKKWVPYGGGYDPKNRGAPAPMAGQATSMYEPAAQSYSAAPADTMTNAPAKTWQPYGGGYDPKNRPGSTSQPLSNVDIEVYASSSTKSGSSWSAPVGYVPKGAASPNVQAQRVAAPVASNGGWKPPTGYGSDTISRVESRIQSEPLSSVAASMESNFDIAPAKSKWSPPPAGYTPRPANAY